MRILVVVFLLVRVLWSLETDLVRQKIESIEQDSIFFKAGNLQLGEGGVVLTRNQSHQVIIAQAKILEIIDGKARAKITAFHAMNQKFLPTPINEVKVGDEVLFRSFYNRAIALAPNQEAYQFILKNNPKIQFMHIDLFAAFLQRTSVNDPKKKHFQAFCPRYSIGLVFIMDSQAVKVLDCQSFTILSTQSLPDSSVVQKQATTPFFSRITAANKRLGSRLKPNKSKNYFAYYDWLLREQ